MPEVDDPIFRGNDFARSLAGAPKPLGPVGKIARFFLRVVLASLLLTTVVASVWLLYGTFRRGAFVAGGVAVALVVIIGASRRRK